MFGYFILDKQNKVSRQSRDSNYLLVHKQLCGGNIHTSIKPIHKVKKGILKEIAKL